ncbi:MAG: SpoIIE family protein phosphatase [Bacteroidales bacterium]|nr:SpoIIE family protein phosphatase [Bacteroidales bacterium]
MKKYLSILLTALISLAAAIAQAQTGYRFYNINKTNGLSSDIITAVTEDGDGFIWVGTQTGLLRYDGQTFVAINDINDSLNLEGSNITDLKTDHNGDLWIATDHGMSKFNIKSETLTNLIIDEDTPNPKANYRTDRIFVTSDNKTYFFTSDGYLYGYNEANQMVESCAYDFFSHKSVKTCFLDIDNTIWAVDRNASTIYHVSLEGRMLDSLECVSKYPFPLVEAYAFVNNGDGTVWIGSYAGIYQIDVDKHTVSLVEEIGGKPLPKSIKAFYKRSNGDIWIGTNTEELFVVNRSTNFVQMIESDHSQQSVRRLNSVTVNVIFEDSNSIMWFGTWHGLSFIGMKNPIKFDAISYPENEAILRQNQISSICQAPDGTLAIGSDGGGIIFWDGVSSRRFGGYTENTPNGKMRSSSVLAMAYDKDGNLWAGGYNNPLVKIYPDRKTSESYSLVNVIKGVTSDFIADILVDNQNRIWVLTNGAGLLNFDPKTKTFTRVLSDSRLVEPVSMYGTCLEEGPDNTILVGTYAGMFVYYPDQDIIENYSYSYGSEYSISHNVVYDIMRDSHHRVWVATAAGVDRLDVRRGIFTHYDGGGLIKNKICTNIIEDVAHDIWITTNSGLLKFNPEVNVVARLYDTDDGLLSLSFEKHASLVTKEGTIYFGTHDGVVFFNTVNVKSITNVPKPVISSLLMSYNRVSPGDETQILDSSIICTNEIELSWRDAFSFEFSVLDYLYGKNTKFFYRLDGYNNQWTAIGLRREIGFTNLDPGRYTLRIVAENSDRMRSEERTLVIKIRPPWYRTKLAIVCFISLCLLILWLIHLLRVHRMRSRQIELEEQVESRTIELMSLNAMLEQRSEEMKQQNEEIQSQRDELFEKNNQLHTSRAEIQKSYERLLELSELDKQISESTDTEAILQTLYQNKVVPLAGCGLCVCKRSKKKNIVEFSKYIQDGQTWELEDEKISELIDPLTAACFDTHNEVIADNSSVYEVTMFLAEMGYRTCVRIPLFSGGDVSAVMIINSPKENAFSKNDIAIFKVIASYSEIVLEKADAYSQIKSKNVAINGSISYAKTIQQLLLSQIDDFNKYFNAEVLYRPKDIVSGDYIWQCVVKANDGFKVFCAVVDCTGHGVPGAFMSLISSSILRENIKIKQIYEPKDILTAVSETTSKVLRQENGENKDGMDMSLCRFDVDSQGNMSQFVYSGAKCPILFRRKSSSECVMIPADRISIAGGVRRLSENRLEFTQQVFEIVPGDLIYMYSDGIIDQSNQERTRFGRKRLIASVNNAASLSPDKQKEQIEKDLDAFSIGTEQRDDITLLILQVRDKVVDVRES